MEEDLERLGIQQWREIVQNREKWRDIVMAAKTLRKYSVPEEEKERLYLINNNKQILFLYIVFNILYLHFIIKSYENIYSF